MCATTDFESLREACARAGGQATGGGMCRIKHKYESVPVLLEPVLIRGKIGLLA